MIGDAGVGKTSMIHCLKDGKFSTHVPTTGFETIDVVVPVTKSNGETIRVKLRLCDTAGQESVTGLSKSYFRGASGIIIVCSEDSLESMQNWEDSYVAVLNLANEV